MILNQKVGQIQSSVVIICLNLCKFINHMLKNTKARKINFVEPWTLVRYKITQPTNKKNTYKWEQAKKVLIKCKILYTTS